MNELKSDSTLPSRDLPRRMRLSAREIAVAMALTFAAATQLVYALSSRDSKAAANFAGADRAALMQPPASTPAPAPVRR